MFALSITNHQLCRPTQRAAITFFASSRHTGNTRPSGTSRVHASYLYSITDANDVKRSSYRNEQYFLSRKKIKGGVLSQRGLAASNPSGMWTVRYNYCTSHNSLKRYSCLWTAAINGVAVSPAILSARRRIRRVCEWTGEEGEREKDGEERIPRTRVRVLIISIIASRRRCACLSFLRAVLGLPGKRACCLLNL